MVADGMLTRKRYREVPPRVDYELTERSRELAPVLGQLARWGYEWAWGPPRVTERIDIGAIFRLIPGLVDPPRHVTGTVQLTVTDGHAGAPAVYRVSIADGAARISEGEADSDAALTGSTPDWVRALSPAGDRGSLTSSGDAGLAMTLLDMLALGQDMQVVEDIDAPAAESATA